MRANPGSRRGHEPGHWLASSLQLVVLTTGPFYNLQALRNYFYRMINVLFIPAEFWLHATIVRTFHEGDPIRRTACLSLRDLHFEDLRRGSAGSVWMRTANGRPTATRRRRCITVRALINSRYWTSVSLTDSRKLGQGGIGVVYGRVPTLYRLLRQLASSGVARDVKTQRLIVRHVRPQR